MSVLAALLGVWHTGLDNNVLVQVSRHPSFWCHIGRNERIGRWAV